MMRSRHAARRLMVRGFALSLLPLVASCGGGGTDAPSAPPTPPPAPVPATIRLSQSGPIVLIAGQNASITATVVDAAGQALPNAVVNWTSTSPTIVGVGGSGSSTNLNAVGPVGTASIQASSGAVTSATVIVNVTAGAPSRLTVTANGTQTRAAGDTTLPMQLRVTDQFNNPVPGVTINWSTTGGTLQSATTASATDGTTSNRLTLGTTAGTFVVTAALQGAAPVTFNITVAAGAPAVVSLSSPRVVLLDSGATTTLTATARDANGLTVPNAAIQFTARNGTVVGTNGNVLSALRRGQSIVTASTGTATPDSLLAVVLGANGISLQTDLTRLEIRPDETFTVPVIVDLRASTDRVASAALTVTFDPTQLTFVSRAAGATGVNATVNDAQSGTGRITLTFADATGFTGRVELLRLTFRATSSTGRTGSLALSATELNSTTFADLMGRLTAITYPLVVR